MAPRVTCHSWECRPANCLPHGAGSLHLGNLNKGRLSEADCLPVTPSCISISHRPINVLVIDSTREMICLLLLCVFVVLALDVGRVRAIIGLDLLFLLPVMLLLSAELIRLFHLQEPWIMLITFCVCLLFCLHSFIGFLTSTKSYVSSEKLNVTLHKLDT